MAWTGDMAGAAAIDPISPIRVVAARRRVNIVNEILQWQGRLEVLRYEVRSKGEICTFYTCSRATGGSNQRNKVHPHSFE